MRELRRSGRVLAAPDKFKGTATARQAADAIAAAAARAAWQCVLVPLSDGGDGFLDVLGRTPPPGSAAVPGRKGPTPGEVVVSRVTGPLGSPVLAGWSLAGRRACIESARASGLSLVGGEGKNDPIAATSRGTGELVALAVRSGATRLLVGVGGSACTDGGLGAVEALGFGEALKGPRRGHADDVEVVVACDVKATFLQAADLFAPQKGATEEQVAALSIRLSQVAEIYRSRLGADITALPGGGAAGGLAGGLAALGARLVPGIELVAAEVGLAGRIAESDLVITGEGAMDPQSFEGKVIGGVVSRSVEAGVPVVAIVGRADERSRAMAQSRGVAVVSLVEKFGEERSVTEPLSCIEQAAAEVLEGHRVPGR